MSFLSLIHLNRNRFSHICSPFICYIHFDLKATLNLNLSLCMYKQPDREYNDVGSMVGTREGLGL